jgi:hypothetical protein
MRKALLFALLAVAPSCSDQKGEQTGPSTIPPSSPPSSSRVVLSGTISAAENGAPIYRTRVEVVDGVNAGRLTFSNDAGRYELANLEPGAFTMLFSNGEFLDLRRAEVVRANTTLDVQLEQKGFVLSGRITTQWGEPIGDVGVEALHDGRIMGGAGGGGSVPVTVAGGYRIPTLPALDYIVRTIKWGYLPEQRPVTMTGDTTLDFVLDRVRVSIFGVVMETPPCSGVIQDARVEIASGPDIGAAASSTATGYQLKNINWGKFWIRASKAGYRTAEVSRDVLSPGSKEGPQELPASKDVRQDFLLQRIVGC